MSSIKQIVTIDPKLLVVPGYIDPYLAPNGLVFETWVTGDRPPERVTRTPTSDLSTAQELAERDGNAALERNAAVTYLIVYDGDSGVLMAALAVERDGG